MGDWGLGIGNWGLGIGPNPQSPIPNPQSPIPDETKNFIFILNFIYNSENIYYFLSFLDFLGRYNVASNSFIAL